MVIENWKCMVIVGNPNLNNDVVLLTSSWRCVKVKSRLSSVAFLLKYAKMQCTNY